MKGNKYLILIFAIFLVSGCTSQVNTSDPQISRSIIDSKKNKVFLKEFALIFKTDTNIVVNEAWSEKTWFYEIHNGVKVKVQKYGCQLCFKLKQTPYLKYRLDKLDKWLMEYLDKDIYVGISYGIYNLGFSDCNIPDSLALNLIDVKDTNSVLKKKIVGNITFKTVNRTR